MRDHQRLHQPLDGQHEAENHGADAAIRPRHVGPQTGSQGLPQRPLMPIQGNQSRQGPQPSRRQRRFSKEVITWRLPSGVGPSHTLYCQILIIFTKVQQTRKEKQPFHRQKPMPINSRGQQRAAGQRAGARGPSFWANQIKLNISILRLTSAKINQRHEKKRWTVSLFYCLVIAKTVFLW